MSTITNMMTYTCGNTGKFMEVSIKNGKYTLLDDICSQICKSCGKCIGLCSEEIPEIAISLDHDIGVEIIGLVSGKCKDRKKIEKVNLIATECKAHCPLWYSLENKHGIKITGDDAIKFSDIKFNISKNGRNYYEERRNMFKILNKK